MRGLSLAKRRWAGESQMGENIGSLADRQLTSKYPYTNVMQGIYEVCACVGGEG